MTPILQSARLTLGPATLAHFEAFVAFTATEDSRFLGGPATAGMPGKASAPMQASGRCAAYGTFWLTDRNSLASLSAV